MMYDTRSARQHRINRYLWNAVCVLTVIVSATLAYIIFTEGF